MNMARVWICRNTYYPGVDVVSQRQGKALNVPPSVRTFHHASFRDKDKAIFFQEKCPSQVHSSTHSYFWRESCLFHSSPSSFGEQTAETLYKNEALYTRAASVTGVYATHMLA